MQTEYLEMLYKRQKQQNAKLKFTYQAKNIDRQRHLSIEENDDQSTDVASTRTNSIDSGDQYRNMNCPDFNESVKLLQNIATNFSLQKETTFYAICYMDLLLREGMELDENGDQSCQMVKIVIVCILIASKFNDIYDQQISARQLQEYALGHHRNISIVRDDIYKLEVLALQTLDSDLWKVLPTHFIQEFRQLLESQKINSVVFEDDSIYENFISLQQDDKDQSCQSFIFAQQKLPKNTKSQVVKKMVKFEQIGGNRKSMIQNYINTKLDQLTQIVMENYNQFQDELQSDIALSIVVCARILAGVHYDQASYSALLKRLQFEKWSSTSIKQHQQTFSNGILNKLLQLTAKHFSNHDQQILRSSLDQFKNEQRSYKYQNEEYHQLQQHNLALFNMEEADTSFNQIQSQPLKIVNDIMDALDKLLDHGVSAIKPRSQTKNSNMADPLIPHSYTQRQGRQYAS